MGGGRRDNTRSVRRDRTGQYDQYDSVQLEKNGVRRREDGSRLRKTTEATSWWRGIQPHGTGNRQRRWTDVTGIHELIPFLSRDPKEASLDQRESLSQRATCKGGCQQGGGKIRFKFEHTSGETQGISQARNVRFLLRGGRGYRLVGVVSYGEVRKVDDPIPGAQKKPHRHRILVGDRTDWPNGSESE